MKIIIGALLLSTVMAGESFAGPISTAASIDRDYIAQHAGSPPLTTKFYESRKLTQDMDSLLKTSTDKSIILGIGQDISKKAMGSHVKREELVFDLKADAPREKIERKMLQQDYQLKKATSLQIKHADWSSYIYKSLGFIGQSCFRFASFVYRYSW